MSKKCETVQRILVVQQNGKGDAKIDGIRRFGGDRFRIQSFSVAPLLPDIIDDSAPFLPERLDADLVLDFLIHPDLSCDLADMCCESGVPLIASGKKHKVNGVLTPPT